MKMSTLTTDNTIIQALKMFTARHDGALFELRIISHKGRAPAAGFFDQKHIEEAAANIAKFQEMNFTIMTTCLTHYKSGFYDALNLMHEWGKI